MACLIEAAQNLVHRVDGKGQLGETRLLMEGLFEIVQTLLLHSVDGGNETLLKLIDHRLFILTSLRAKRLRSECVDQNRGRSKAETERGFHGSASTKCVSWSPWERQAAP